MRLGKMIGGLRRKMRWRGVWRGRWSEFEGVDARELWATFGLIRMDLLVANAIAKLKLGVSNAYKQIIT